MSDFIWNANVDDKTYTNPILYADYSDPDAIRVGDDYYMIASSFCNAPGVPLLHSKDMVNWKVVNYVWNRIPDERYNSPVHGCGAWAPAIRYHDGVFYAFIPMPDEGIYVSKTTDPYGTWDEPINIRPKSGWIDPCPFWDDDGRAYMVAGVAKSRIGYKSVLHLVEMSSDATRLIGEEVKIFDGNENDQETIEGPKMYKRNGWYYIFAPAGGVKTGWQTVLRSKNIYGPYEYKVVMRQGDTPVNGPHQGAWVTTPSGQDWFIHFQDVYGAGRITHLQPMTWLDNDWPIIGEPVEGTDYGVPVLRYTKPDVGNIYPPCEPATSDSFTGDRLGLQWQWNANPEDNWYSLSGDGIRLNSAFFEDNNSLGDLPNLLLQKWPAPEFSCTVEMDYSDLALGDTSGFVNMGMTYAALAVERDANGFNLVTYTGEQTFSGVNWSSVEEKNLIIGELAGSKIYFRYSVKVTGQRDLSLKERNFPLETVTLSYSTDNIKFTEVCDFDAQPGRWVGVKFGLFAKASSPESTGSAIFKNLVVQR